MIIKMFFDVQRVPEAVKQLAEVRKHFLAKAPSRQVRQEDKVFLLRELGGLAPLRELVLNFPYLPGTFSEPQAEIPWAQRQQRLQTNSCNALVIARMLGALNNRGKTDGSSS